MAAKNIKDYYITAIKVADQILQDPRNNVNEVLKSRLGYENGIKGFLTDPSTRWPWAHAYFISIPV